MSEHEFVYIRVGGTKSDRLIICRSKDFDWGRAREEVRKHFPDMFDGKQPSLTTVGWEQLADRVKEQLWVCQRGNNWNDRPYVAIQFDYSDGDRLCRVAGAAE